MTAHDAAQIRQTRRARVRTIRGRVLGYSVALFMVVWALIAVLLVTGHDPALSRHAVAATTSGSTGSSVSTGESGSDDSGSFSSAGSSNTAGSSNSTGSGGFVSPSPVTSGQS